MTVRAASYAVALHGRRRTTGMPIYERDEQAAPDSDFEPGVLEHLVPGNAGRLLDPRRTPVRVVSLNVVTGTFDLRIEGYEDEGAIWNECFEHVGFYQFERGCERAAPEQVAACRAVAAGFDRPLIIPAQLAALPETDARLDRAERDAAAWMVEHSRWLAEGARLPDVATLQGSPLLADDLARFMQARDLAGMEKRFARQFVSNPASGELVKGHRLVIAALGLVDFEGKAIRDLSLFDGEWSRARRAEHIVARLGFVRAWLAAAGLETVPLHRGVSTDEAIVPVRNKTFVSTTFSLDVATAHFEAADEGSNRLVASREVPAARVFMTYVETSAMNAPFKEAEAVLLYERGRHAF